MKKLLIVVMFAGSFTVFAGLLPTLSQQSMTNNQSSINYDGQSYIATVNGIYHYNTGKLENIIPYKKNIVNPENSTIGITFARGVTGQVITSDILVSVCTLNKNWNYTTDIYLYNTINKKWHNLTSEPIIGNFSFMLPNSYSNNNDELCITYTGIDTTGTDSMTVINYREYINSTPVFI